MLHQWGGVWFALRKAPPWTPSSRGSSSGPRGGHGLTLTPEGDIAVAIFSGMRPTPYGEFSNRGGDGCGMPK